jgi:hypothetical protein
MDQSNQQFILISYFPFIKLDHQICTIAEPNFLQTLLDNTIGSEVRGVAWVQSETISPILIIDRATELVEHLQSWSDQEIQNKFVFKHLWYNNVYALALIPKVEESTNRWKINFQLQFKYPPPPDLEFTVLFHPIQFISNSKADTYLKIRHLIKDITNIGFINSRDWDPSNPEKSLDKSIIIKNIVVDNSDNHLSFMKGLIDDNQ